MSTQTVLSFRASPAQRLLLEAAAAHRRVSLAHLLRELVLAGLRREIISIARFSTATTPMNEASGTTLNDHAQATA
jgi:hypothetical protein